MKKRSYTMNTTQYVVNKEKAKVASFDVDPQKSFTPLFPDELPVAGGHLIAAALNTQAELAGFRVGSKDIHATNAYWVADEKNPQFSPVDPQFHDMDIHWKAHCILGTEGVEFLDELPKADKYDFMVYKGIERHMHPYGACYHDLGNKKTTGVIEVLRANGIELVLVGGLATDYCVKNTAIQLKLAGFDVVVNLSACRHIADETLYIAIKEMVDLGIVVADTVA
jgi:nicotinamidase/pyrazinamidase